MPPRSESVPHAMRATYEAIVALIDPVCAEHLNAEYADLCHRLAAALARKRPSPLARGRPAIWACAIVHTIGMVNFLSDRSRRPHLGADELCRLFGVNPNSAGAKSLSIRKLFHIYPLDPRWTLPSRIDQNPYVWTLLVNGLPMDMR